MGHCDQEVVTNLDVGEYLQEGGDERVRRAIFDHPGQSRCIICVDVDVSEFARGASNRWCDQSQRDNGSEKFFDVDACFVINSIEVQFVETRGKRKRSPKKKYNQRGKKETQMLGCCINMKRVRSFGSLVRISKSPSSFVIVFISSQQWRDMKWEGHP